MGLSQKTTGGLRERAAVPYDMVVKDFFSCEKNFKKNKKNNFRVWGIFSSLNPEKNVYYLAYKAERTR